MQTKIAHLPRVTASRRQSEDGFVPHRRHSILRDAAAILSDRFGAASLRRSGHLDRPQCAEHGGTFAKGGNLQVAGLL